MFREIGTDLTKGDRSEVIEGGRISDAEVSLNRDSVVYSPIVLSR